ncbi:DUF6226 family protein [Arthrobacter sp. TMN-49]
MSRGRPINYGSRWGEAWPPEVAASRVRNLQRFATVQAVATFGGVRIGCPLTLVNAPKASRERMF